MSVFLKTAIKRLKKSERLERVNRDYAYKAIAFNHGDQWDEDALNERIRQERPAYTFNKLLKHILQIIGDIRQNMPGRKAIPRKDSTQQDAKLADELMRTIEIRSKAERVYTNAGFQALDGGFGYVRVVPREEQDNIFEQRISIEFIPDRFSVYLDRPTTEKKNRRWGFVLESVDKERFKELDFDVKFDEVKGLSMGVQKENEKVIAEYYWIVRKEVRLAQVVSQSGRISVEEINEENTEQSMLEKGYNIVDVRTKVRDKVMMSIISENKVLEKPRPFPGNRIPIVDFVGLEYYDNGGFVTKCVTDSAFDAQRSYNSTLTTESERLSMSPRMPFLITKKQRGNNTQWNDFHRYNYSFLEYTPDPRAGGRPSRVEPPTASSGALSMASLNNLDVMDTIGRYEASFGGKSNERTGRAIQIKAGRSDMTMYQYVDNFLESILEVNNIVLGMIPEVMPNEQMIVTALDDGVVSELIINKEFFDIETLEPLIMNDVSGLNIDIVAETSYNYRTKRQESRAELGQLISQTPMYQEALLPLFIKYGDYPGAEEALQAIEMINSRNASIAQAQMQGGNVNA